MTGIVVSPHLDDAVLSANRRLQRGDAAVLTVFAGLPPASFGVGPWDGWTAARSSRERMLARYAEDDEAMRRLGAPAPIRLDEMDRQYRTKAPADVPTIARRLAGLLTGQVPELWIPAAIGGHPDHVTTRDACLYATAGSGREVWLYADFPYVTFFGWPDWVTGTASSPYLDAARWLDGELAARGIDWEELERHVVKLGPAAAARKRHVIEAYATQLPALGLDPRTLDAHPGLVGFELAWRVPAPVLAAWAKRVASP